MQRAQVMAGDVAAIGPTGARVAQESPARDGAAPDGVDRVMVTLSPQDRSWSVIARAVAMSSEEFFVDSPIRLRDGAELRCEFVVHRWRLLLRGQVSHHGRDGRPMAIRLRRGDSDARELYEMLRAWLPAKLPEAPPVGDRPTARGDVKAANLGSIAGEIEIAPARGTPERAAAEPSVQIEPSYLVAV